jgi:hypothetical protein
MEDKLVETERMLARQKEQQQSYMAHWRVKMNPSSATSKVTPLPLEGEFYLEIIVIIFRCSR